MPEDGVRKESSSRGHCVLTLALDKVDDLDGSLGDVGHILAMRELAEEGRSADDDIDTVDTWKTAQSP